MATAPPHPPIAPPPASGADHPQPGPPSPPPTKVRVEIQALRAAAVVLVVTYHLWPSAAPGGFVGVDVFFVISGYLITSLLLREIDRSGRLSLSGFWARRARRILPAALTTVLFCAVATVLFVPLSYWQQFFGDMRASTAYVQNWHLSAAAVDYFAAENGPSPVQHYWSLSAEEQFYMVWPLLMIVALAITRARSARAQRSAIAGVMALLTAGSLGYGLYATAAHPAVAYFVTPTRAWEFGAGGLLSVVRDPERPPSVSRSVLSWTGLTAILLSALTYTESTPFPGTAALLPVLGTTAVIRAGAPVGRGAPTPLLGLRPVQFLGDISYSVYLWHWPLLVLAPFVIGTIHPETPIGIFMLTIFIAWLSKRLIEDPVRRAAFLAKHAAKWTFASAAAATIVVLAVTIGASSHVQAELHKAQVASGRVLAHPPRCFGAASRDPERPCRNPALRLKVIPTPLHAQNTPNAACTVIERRNGVSVCAFGTSPARATRTVALIGDSHAMHWRGALNVVVRTKRWRGLSITHASCPLSTAVRDLPEPDRSRCTRWRREVFRWLAAHRQINTIFVAGLSGGSGVVPARGRSAFETAVAGFRGAWRRLPPSVRHVVVLRDTPKARAGAAGCVEKAMARHIPAGTACAGRRSAVLSRDPAAVAAARLRSPRVQTLDLTTFFCGPTRCLPVVGGALVYKDVTHMTATYSRTLGPYVLRGLDRLMASWS